MEIKIKKSEKFDGFYEMYLDNKICRVVDEKGEEMTDAYEKLLSLFPSGPDGSLNEHSGLHLQNVTASFFPENEMTEWKYPNNDDLKDIDDYLYKNER